MSSSTVEPSPEASPPQPASSPSDSNNVIRIKIVFFIYFPLFPGNLKLEAASSKLIAPSSWLSQ